MAASKVFGCLKLFLTTVCFVYMLSIISLNYFNRTTISDLYLKSAFEKGDRFPVLSFCVSLIRLVVSIPPFGMNINCENLTNSECLDKLYEHTPRDIIREYSVYSTNIVERLYGDEFEIKPNLTHPNVFLKNNQICHKYYHRHGQFSVYDLDVTRYTMVIISLWIVTFTLTNFPVGKRTSRILSEANRTFSIGYISLDHQLPGIAVTICYSQAKIIALKVAFAQKMLPFRQKSSRLIHCSLV